MAACKLSVPKLADTYARVRDVSKCTGSGELIKEAAPSVSLVVDRN